MLIEKVAAAFVGQSVWNSLYPAERQDVVDRAQHAVSLYLQENVPDQLVCRHLRLDLVNRRIYAHGKFVHLSPKKLGVVQYLMQNAGKIMPNRQILCAVWGAEFADNVEYLRVAVKEIRRVLPDTIETRMKFGYIIEK